MERQRLQAAVGVAVFWGSVWGAFEATAGYLLHLAGIPGLAGFFMFPAGYYFMSRALRQTGRASVVLVVAPIAAMVKLVDLLLPTHSVFATLNPVAAILVQGGMVTWLLLARPQVGLAGQILQSAGASFGWRAFYLALAWLLGIAFHQPSLWNHSNLEIICFFLVDGAVNAGLIWLLCFGDTRVVRRFSGATLPSTYSAALAFLAAIGLQIIL